MRSAKNQLNIKFCRLSNFSIQSSHHHFSSVDDRRLLGMTVWIEAADSFEHQEFCRETLVTLKKRRSTGDGRCNSCGGDFRFGPVPWHLHQHGAAAHFDRTSSFIETENSVCAQTRDGQVGEG